jgi:regulator of RNase E activity RraA
MKLEMGFGFLTNFERPPRKVWEEYRDFATSNIADAMGRFGAMEHSIKPIAERMKIVGPAVTVRLRTGDNLMAHQAIAIAEPGDVIVIDAAGNVTNAVWGEIMSFAAQTKGVGGLVIDGAIRDRIAIVKLGFPVFAKAVIPTACDKDGPGEVNLPISCGGVLINPGDLIVGDDDGVVIVPRERLGEVSKKVRDIQMKEKARIKDIENGKVIPAWLNKVMLEKLGA